MSYWRSWVWLHCVSYVSPYHVRSVLKAMYRQSIERIIGKFDVEVPWNVTCHMYQ
jgi:hypothetical protein